MKLSTKGRYGVRFMLDLAMHYGEGPIFLKDIAERQGISEKYLWQLVSPLKSAGFINTVRGSKGGFYLSRDPGNINLMEIIRILEGPICFVDCVEDPKLCDRSQGCISRDVWGEASRKVGEIFTGITLESMVEKQRGKTQDSALFI